MAIAPMANVTDAAFRTMFALVRREANESILRSLGEGGQESIGPDVFWTEFVSVEGLLSAGREKLLVDFWFSEAEHPMVAQVFGSKPEQFEEVGGLIRKLGFDGVDINMGCPDRGVENSGAGASLIKNPKLAKELIRSLKKGVGDLPVSVKTRIGYNKNEIAEWIPALLEEDLAALTVHLRTRKEMSLVPAHWDLATSIVTLRDRIAPGTILLGNGDISSLDEGRLRAAESGMDGVMVGTGIFGNPWFFSGRIPDTREKLLGMVRHAELFEKLFKSNVSKAEGRLKNFDVMKKHFKAYVTGFDNAKELRTRLMETESAGEVRKITEEFLGTL